MTQPTDLTGYGAASYSQAASWASVVLHLRSGDPVGADVASLLSLQQKADDGLVVGQFVDGLADTAESSTVAAWSLLAAGGGTGIVPREKKS
jgi:hypothetical protein